MLIDVSIICQFNNNNDYWRILSMNKLTLENDSLVFSEAFEEINLLLSDEMEEIPTVSRYHRPK
jgi:hypothetical protein